MYNYCKRMVHLLQSTAVVETREFWVFINSPVANNTRVLKFLLSTGITSQALNAIQRESLRILNDE